MKKAIEIIKNIFTPIFEEFNLNIESISIDWNKLTTLFVDYDINPEPLITEIKALPLNNTEKILSKLPELYDTFIDELAEDHVLGNHSNLTEELLDNNLLFKEKVSFYTLIKGVITKMERKRIIEDLQAEDAFSEKDIESAFKKKGRDELRAKFKEWDRELEEEVKQGEKDKPKGNIIPLFWKQLAVAASIAVIIGIFYYTSQNFGDPKFEVAQTPEYKISVIQDTGLGYTDPTSDKKEIPVYYGKSSDDQKSFYFYTENELYLYNIPSKDILLLSLDNKFYLKLNNKFYNLNVTNDNNEIDPKPLKEVTDKNTIEQLEKIIFINQ